MIDSQPEASLPAVNLENIRAARAYLARIEDRPVWFYVTGVLRVSFAAVLAGAVLRPLFSLQLPTLADAKGKPAIVLTLTVLVMGIVALIRERRDAMTYLSRSEQDAVWIAQLTLQRCALPGLSRSDFLDGAKAGLAAAALVSFIVMLAPFPDALAPYRERFGLAAALVASLPVAFGLGFMALEWISRRNFVKRFGAQ